MEKSFDYDSILPLVGEFGFYQKILFVLMLPANVFVVCVYFTQIFITLVPQHWCWVPELKNITSSGRSVM